MLAASLGLLITSAPPAVLAQDEPPAAAVSDAVELEGESGQADVEVSWTITEADERWYLEASGATGEAIARRTVFDRLGADARATGRAATADLAPVASDDLDGDGPFDLSPEHRITWLDISTGAPSMHAEVIGQDVDAPAHVGIMPFPHHLLDELGIMADAARLGVRPFVGAPNITALTAGVVEGPAGRRRASIRP